MNKGKLVNFEYGELPHAAVHTGLLLVLLSFAKGFVFHLYFNLDLLSSRSDPGAQIDRLTAVGMLD